MTTNNNNRSPIAGIIAVILLVSAAVGAIVFLKRSTTRILDAEGNLITQPDSQVAHPTIGSESPHSLDTTDTQFPDTILGTDARDVSDAGYEDGYWAGYDDAHLGQERASYDESCNFPSETDRRKYTLNYREGYKEGWQVGNQDRLQHTTTDNTEE